MRACAPLAVAFLVLCAWWLPFPCDVLCSRRCSRCDAASYKAAESERRVAFERGWALMLSCLDQLYAYSVSVSPTPAALASMSNPKELLLPRVTQAAATADLSVDRCVRSQTLGVVGVSPLQCDVAFMCPCSHRACLTSCHRVNAQPVARPHPCRFRSAFNACHAVTRPRREARPS